MPVRSKGIREHLALPGEANLLYIFMPHKIFLQNILADIKARYSLSRSLAHGMGGSCKPGSLRPGT